MLKNKLLFIFSLLFLLNCSSSSKFIDTKNVESIEDLNSDIEGKYVLIHQKNQQAPIRSDSVLVTKDTLYYFNPYSIAIPLDDIDYLKEPTRYSGLSLLPGFALIGYGVYYGNSSSGDASLGEGLGRGLAGVTLVSLGALATVIGIITNKNRYYYFKEDYDVEVVTGSNIPCRNPRFKKRCD